MVDVKEKNQTEETDKTKNKSDSQEKFSRAAYQVWETFAYGAIFIIFACLTSILYIFIAAAMKSYPITAYLKKNIFSKVKI